MHHPANFSFGVDPNRNYGAFWGGPGSSAGRTAANQVTVAINNHTPDERLVRVPSSSNEPVPADVAVYDALAQLLGADLNFPAGPWPEIQLRGERDRGADRLLRSRHGCIHPRADARLRWPGALPSALRVRRRPVPRHGLLRGLEHPGRVPDRVRRGSIQPGTP